MAKGLRQIVNFTAAIVSVVFSIVVLGVIADKVLKKVSDVENTKLCFYEFDPNSSTSNLSTSICDFGIAMGAIGLLVSIAYTVFGAADLFVEVEVLLSPLALLLRTAGAGVMAILWMICFAVLTNAYNNKSAKDAANVVDSSAKSGMQAGIAFSFLTTLLWVIILGFTLSAARAAKSAGTFQAGTSAGADSNIQPKPLQES